MWTHVRAARLVREEEAMIQHIFAGALLSLSLAAPASATWLSGSELRSHCNAYLDNPESRDGALCAAFVQGFLAGTRTAEKDREAPALWSGAAADESFAERATRTRVGSRLRSLEANAGYCVGDDVSAGVVIRSVAEHLNDRPENVELSTERRVRNALVQRFPCDDG
jgi:hypothetical protein